MFHIYLNITQYNLQYTFNSWWSYKGFIIACSWCDYNSSYVWFVSAMTDSKMSSFKDATSHQENKALWSMMAWATFRCTCINHRRTPEVTGQQRNRWDFSKKKYFALWSSQLFSNNCIEFVFIHFRAPRHRNDVAPSPGTPQSLLSHQQTPHQPGTTLWPPLLWMPLWSCSDQPGLLPTAFPPIPVSLSSPSAFFSLILQNKNIIDSSHDSLAVSQLKSTLLLIDWCLNVFVLLLAAVCCCQARSSWKREF